MIRSIILAAGKGERLMPLTADKPKCLVPLLGRSLIERQIATFRSAGVNDITIVGGYQADQLGTLGQPVIVNPDFEVTNMVASLFCARDRLDGKADVIISYGDIVYETRVLDALFNCREELCLTSDTQWCAYWRARMERPLADVQTFKIGDGGWVTELGKKPESLESIQGQYMGLFKVRADQVPKLVDAYDAMDRSAHYDGKNFDNMFMTSFLQHLIDMGWSVRAVPVDGGWLEVDTADDLARYERLHWQGKLDRFFRL